MKVFLVFLILCIGCLIHANIVEFFESIPPVVRYAVGTVITVYALSWAYSWVFDPIVIVAENGYGAFNFGPFIVIEPCIWYSNDIEWRNTVLNHEYTHYVQHAVYGPILSISYPILALYSNIKSGNQWDDTNQILHGKPKRRIFLRQTGHQTDIGKHQGFQSTDIAFLNALTQLMFFFPG